MGRYKGNEYKLAGLCVRCGNPPTPPYKSCERCRRAHREYENKRALKYSKAKKCRNCGSTDLQTQQGLVTCRRCSSINTTGTALRRIVRRKNGHCPQCGKIPEDGVFCVACRKKQNANKRLRARRLFDRILQYYGERCACCGETEKVFLTIDHIKGGGNQHRKIVKNGDKFHHWLIRNNFPAGFQVLCFNCNCAKSRVGVCPHREQTEKYRSYYG